MSIFLLGAGWLEAAKLLPPSEYLTKQENVLMVARAEAGAEAGKVVFRQLEILHGEAPELVEVRLGGTVEKQIVFGDTYFVGVTFLRALLREKNTFEPDPEGPRAVAIPAVGDALLEDTPAVRTLVTPREPDEPLGDRRRLDAILAQVQSSHEPTRRFVLAELVLRPNLVGLLDDKDMTVLRGVVEPYKALENQSHEYLLRGLMQRDELDDQLWVAKDCRGILGFADTELDLTSFEPALVLSAATMLGRVGQASDVPLLARHLASNNPGVARAAFESMLELDREQAVVAARKALQDGGLHPDTRRRLETEATVVVFPGDEDE
jgi:hypothetical protein